MTWNYRIIRYQNGLSYGLHEVHYNEDGEPINMTKNPMSFVCNDYEGKEGIIKSLEMALKDAQERPVLDDPWPPR